MFLYESWRKISYTYENYINPSISTSLEHNIDWQKTFHLHHFPPVFGRILREAKPLREMMKMKDLLPINVIL